MRSLLSRVRRVENALRASGTGGTYGRVVRSGSPTRVRQVLDWIAGIRRSNPEAWVYVANLARSPDLRARDTEVPPCRA